jgi:hypothetical protein
VNTAEMYAAGDAAMLLLPEPGDAACAEPVARRSALSLGRRRMSPAHLRGVSPCRLWRAARSGLKIGVGRPLTSFALGPYEVVG